MAKKELFRVNINLLTEVNEWYQNESERMGISKSAIMAMALMQYMESKKVMKDMGQLNTLLEKVQALQMQK